MSDRTKPRGDQMSGSNAAEAEKADAARRPPTKEAATGETDDPADIVDEHRTERPVEDLGGEID